VCHPLLTAHGVCLLLRRMPGGLSAGAIHPRPTITFAQSGRWPAATPGRHGNINIGLQMPNAANRTTDRTDHTDGKRKNTTLYLLHPCHPCNPWFLCAGMAEPDFSATVSKSGDESPHSKVRRVRPAQGRPSVTSATSGRSPGARLLPPCNLWLRAAWGDGSPQNR